MGAYSAVYKCKDANGKWIYSDKANACNQAQEKNGGGLDASSVRPLILEVEKPAKIARPAGSGASLGSNADVDIGAAEDQAAEKSEIPNSTIHLVPEVKPATLGITEKLSYVLVGIGAIISLYYAVVLLVKAFQTSIWWGLGYLLVPFVPFAFIAIHWESAKRPFWRSFWALPFLLAGVGLMGSSMAGNASRLIQNLPITVGQKPGFQCEGKIRCNQMLSCEEAEFYLSHCPNVEIDGDNDGIPCERQLCN